MASAPTPVDHAFDRCRLLARIVEREYKRARDNPTDVRYVELGITDQGGTKKAEAQSRIEEAFSELVALVDHLTILDMAATFESLFNARLTTAVGGARKTLREKHGASVLAGRTGLIREVDDFQGLAKLTQLIDSDLGSEIKEQIESVRDNRNRFAHGTDLQTPPTILKDDARNALNVAVDLLNSPW